MRRLTDSVGISQPRVMHVCLSARLSAQWLESIEVMKSALQQKMMDLESEKVKLVATLT